MFYALQSLRLPVWSATGPQEAFFPLTIAAIMIGMSLFILSRSLLSSPTQNMGKSEEQEEKSEISVFRVSTYGILMILYAIFFEKVGFLITSALFLLLVLRGTEKQNWQITIWISLAAIVGSYFLFVYFLAVPLPEGFLKW